MSMDEAEYWGAFTDLERDAGVPGLMLGGENESHDNEAMYKEETRLLRREAVELIAHLSSSDEVKEKVVKKLLNYSLQSMISNYAKSEGLPRECVNLARQIDALPVLLKGFVKKIIGGFPTFESVHEMELLCQEIYENKNLEIVYDRVARIQGFIHDLTIRKSGDESHHLLPKKLMKNLLSTARLHLNIIDIKTQDTIYLSYIFTKSKEASDVEKVSPRHGYIGQGKKHIRNWRVIHLMSLMQFQNHNIGNKIQSILKINPKKDLKDFKLEIINIYSGEASKCETGEWRQVERWR